MGGPARLLTLQKCPSSLPSAYLVGLTSLSSPARAACLQRGALRACAAGCSSCIQSDFNVASSPKRLFPSPPMGPTPPVGAQIQGRPVPPSRRPRCLQSEHRLQNASLRASATPSSVGLPPLDRDTRGHKVPLLGPLTCFCVKLE